MTPDPAVPDQPSLLPDADPIRRKYALRKKSDDGFLFTGERLKEIDPERYDLLVKLIADDTLSQNEIARVMGVAVNTVRAIKRSQGGSIDTIRASLVSRCEEIQGATLDRIQEILDDTPTHLLDLRALAAILREVGNRSDALTGGKGSSGPAVPTDDGPSALAEANAARRAKLREMSEGAVTLTEGIHFTVPKTDPPDAAARPPATSESGASDSPTSLPGTNNDERKEAQ